MHTSLGDTWWDSCLWTFFRCSLNSNKISIYLKKLMLKSLFRWSGFFGCRYDRLTQHALPVKSGKALTSEPVCINVFSFFFFFNLNNYKKFHSSWCIMKTRFLEDGNVALKPVILNYGVHFKRGPSAVNPSLKQLNFVNCLQYNETINTDEQPLADLVW